MSDLKDIWNQKSAFSHLREQSWEQWLAEIEVISEQQEIEMPATEELEQLYSQGKTPLEVLVLQESE